MCINNNRVLASYSQQSATKPNYHPSRGTRLFAGTDANDCGNASSTARAVLTDITNEVASSNNSLASENGSDTPASHVASDASVARSSDSPSETRASRSSDIVANGRSSENASEAANVEELSSTHAPVDGTLTTGGQSTDGAL